MLLCITKLLVCGLAISMCVCLILFSGRVIDGLLVLRKIENIPTGPNNKPKIPVTISQCGEM